MASSAGTNRAGWQCANGCGMSRGNRAVRRGCCSPSSGRMDTTGGAYPRRRAGGCRVRYPSRPTIPVPGQLLALVQREEVDLLGLSSLAGAHGELVPMVLRGLQEKGLRTPVVIGGVIPEADVRGLLAAGVQTHFGPGSDLLEIAERLLDIVCRTRPEACSLPAMCQEG
ncbi:cobalamin B12-binding domain-containing protein [Azotobacter sp. CWF10]